MVQTVPETRNSARLATVQALYEIDATRASVDPVLMEFLNRRWQDSVVDKDDNPIPMTAFDQQLLKDLVEGVMANCSALDAEIAGGLSEQWTLERLDMLMRAILRAGVYELANHMETPARVIISEYMDVAVAFYGTNEPAMVNGVLNHLAQKIRAHEMK